MVANCDFRFFNFSTLATEVNVGTKNTLLCENKQPIRTLMKEMLKKHLEKHVLENREISTIVALFFNFGLLGFHARHRAEKNFVREIFHTKKFRSRP